MAGGKTANKSSISNLDLQWRTPPVLPPRRPCLAILRFPPVFGGDDGTRLALVTGIGDSIMNKRNIYITGVAFVIAGTAGIASWMSAEVDAPIPGAVATLGASAPGVAETEGVVAAPVTVAPEVAALAPTAPVELVASAPAPATPSRVRTPIAQTSPRTTAPAPPSTGANEARDVSPAAEPARVPGGVETEEPAPRVDRVELTVPTGTVLGIRLNTAVTSENAEVEDRVEGTVTRDVIANGHVAIPSGTRVLGSVNEVTRGGKFKERARIGIRFHTLVLADGAREAVRVDAVVREGDSPTRESAAKIGIGAAGGAIVGGIMGGKKGALLGGAAGAGAGAAAVAAGDRSVAAIAAGTPLSIRLDAPVRVTIDRGP